MFLKLKLSPLSLFPPSSTGYRLLHVPYRWLWRGGRHDAQQCGVLHQPLVRAQLLLTRHQRGGPEAHRHLCPVQDLPGRGAYCHDCPVMITMGQISLAMVDNNQTFSHPLKRGGGSPVVNVSRLSLPLQYLTQVMLFVNFSPRNSNTV